MSQGLNTDDTVLKKCCIAIYRGTSVLWEGKRYADCSKEQRGKDGEGRNQLWPGMGSSERRGAGRIQPLFFRESLCFRNKLLTVEKISTERKEAQILEIVESLPPKPTYSEYHICSHDENRIC